MSDFIEEKCEYCHKKIKAISPKDHRQFTADYVVALHHQNCIPFLKEREIHMWKQVFVLKQENERLLKLCARQAWIQPPSRKRKKAELPPPLKKKKIVHIEAPRYSQEEEESASIKNKLISCSNE